MQESTCSELNASSIHGGSEATKPSTDGLSQGCCPEKESSVKFHCHDNEQGLNSVDGADNVETKKCCSSKIGDVTSNDCCSKRTGSHNHDDTNATYSSNGCCASERTGCCSKESSKHPEKSCIQSHCHDDGEKACSVESTETVETKKCCSSKDLDTISNDRCSKRTGGHNHEEKNGTSSSISCCAQERTRSCPKDSSKCCSSNNGDVTSNDCCSKGTGSHNATSSSDSAYVHERTGCCSKESSKPPDNEKTCTKSYRHDEEKERCSVEGPGNVETKKCCSNMGVDATSNDCCSKPTGSHDATSSSCCVQERTACCSREASKPHEILGVKSHRHDDGKELCSVEGVENVEIKKCCSSKVVDAISNNCCSRHLESNDHDEWSLATSSNSCCAHEKKDCCRNEDGLSFESQSSNPVTCCAKSVHPGPVSRKSSPNDCCGDMGNECCVKPSCDKDTSCCDEGCEKECCAIALHLVPSFVANSTGNTGRSTFYVQEICCATEIAAIRSIVEPLVGVASARINPTVKKLYVDHDLDMIKAADICDALNRERFGAHIVKDAALEAHAISCFVTSILELTDQKPPDKEAILDFLSNFDSRTLQSSTLDVDGKTLTLVHNSLIMSARKFVQALSGTLGLKAQVIKDGSETLEWDFKDISDQQKEEDPALALSHSSLRPTVVLSGILWIVSMLSFIGGDWEYLKYVALFSVAFGLPPIALKAVVSLRGFRFDINCLMTFATIGAIALRDFTEAAAVTFLFALSEWLELRATSRARNALSSIVQLRPERANLIHPKSGEIVVVPVGVVPVGALVSVKAGDKIPCDGVVIEGQSTVDESSLTGESRPVRKGPGDGVSGGTINSGNTQMTVRTTASSEDSAVARLIRLVEEAQANRSDTERLVDDFASIYTPVVILAAICMCTIPWGWGPEVGSKWTELGLVLIVIACPCALIISTPVTYVAGLAATAQRGVLIKGGAHLEALGMVKTVCFDKTGTLTQGKFQLLHLDIFGTKFSRKGVLEYLSLMEDRASHPLARALVEGAETEGVKVPQGRFVRNHTFLPGEGIVGTIDGVTVHVGNQRLLERLGLYATLSESEQNKVDEWGKIGTVGFMCVGENDIVCAYCVADAIRPEATEIVQHLKVLGIDVMMVTGDKKETALSIGNAIGLALNNIRSELLPEDKLAIVSDLKLGRSGRQSVLTNFCSSGSLVLMCGDGVNDAPALAAADVGVAVAGSTLAMETADVTLLDSKLTKLVYSVEMGRRAIRKIKENVTFSLVVKFLVLGFALAGKAALWAAIASDVGAMLVVTLNSMMLLPAKGTTTAETADIGNISTESTRKDEKEVQDIEQACTEEEKS